MRNGEWRVDRSPSIRNEYRRRWQQVIRLRVIDLLGGKCVECGYTKDARALQIDHIYSDARVDKVKKGTSYYYHVLNNLSSGRYQVLCANCNVIKRADRHECPLRGRDGPNP
jgi:5-methylcytosine-specific restriction endonuclease McrA